MTSNELLKLDIDDRNVATLTLNRPEVHNAFNAELVAELHASFDKLANGDTPRVLVLAGAGKSFSAGADMTWMKGMAAASEADNRADAKKLAAMLRALDELPCPTVARVHGAAFGGGVGLVACCDIAVAGEKAKFSLSEVRLGLIPATIASFVISRIGTGEARRWMLTAGRMDAKTARRIGLVHETAGDLDETLAEIVDELIAGGPAAQAECKHLIRHLRDHRGVPETIDAETADWIARLRVSGEGQEGLGAFLEKRKPGWQGNG